MNFVNLFLNFAYFSEFSVVTDVLNEKGVSEVININCYNKDTILWQKLFNYKNIKTANFHPKRQLSKLSLNHIKTGIIINTLCLDWKHALKAFPEDIFKSRFVWIVITDDLLSTANVLSNYPIEIDSDVTIILKSRGNYELYEVYHIDYSKGTFSIREIGNWNSTLHMTNVGRRDVSGLIIKFTVVVTEKIVNETLKQYLSRPRNYKIDSLHKLKFYELINYIRDLYNFSYELQRTNSWGYLRNGSFDGVVGALQFKLADVGGSPLFLRGDRAQLIDYIAETWQSRQCFILRHPKHPGGILTIYTRPLTARVWYCIISMLGISGIVLSLMLKAKITTAGVKADSSFSIALLFVWGAICQQGMSIDRTTTAVKMVVFVTFIYALTLYQYYNATVVSTLLREPPKNIRTLEDLIKSNIKTGVEDVLYTKDYFKRTTDPIAIDMYQKKIVPDHQYNFFSADHGMALVKKGGFAFHVDSVAAYRIMRSTFTEREICEAHEVPMYPPQKMGLVVRKLSPYKEYFAYGVRRLFETGVMHRLRSVWDEPKPACVHTPDSSVFSVTLHEFSMALIALLAGAAAAVLVLIAEIIVHSFKNRNYIDFRL
uniref:Ionotropic receptor 64a n=2 Tax=Heortia vitessoides TaxID=1557813 RepID=A0A978W765_9NEOP|nr:ionotropic receptor 64a [Heortia vitessoides]